MKKSFKKNQIIITALAIMIAVAGYINYSGHLRDLTGFGKDTEKEVDANGDIISNDKEPDDSSMLEPGSAILTSANQSSVISAAKLNREQVRARNKETLLEIVDNAEITENVKANAIDQLTQLVGNAEKEMAAELLLEAKGFSDVVVSFVDGKVDIVVNLSELTDSQRVQIEDIAKRKMEVSADKITINICNN